MTYLLDTHILIWWRQDDPRLPHRWDNLFSHKGDSEVLFSIVSIWEIAIKRALGKLELAGALEDFATSLETRHGFRRIPVELNDICRMERLPKHHGDPFDRLLIAQCLEHRATAVTDDSRWKKYSVKVAF